MIKTDNLYAEVVINESPFFYDEHGRLRAHTLNEQPQVVSEEQTLDEMSVRGPEATQSVIMMPSTPVAAAPVTSTASNGAPPKPPIKKRWDLGPLPPSLKKVGSGPVKQPEVKIPDQKVSTDQGMNELGASRQQKPGMGGKKPFRSFRFSNQSQAGAGRNMNTRAGLSGAKPMQGRPAPATSYLEEKINLKSAKMGDVIKDFQESDAPQFKGKSKEKRRIMAIAAKLQADRGAK